MTYQRIHGHYQIDLGTVVRVFPGKTIAPTVNDDSSAGYIVSDDWIDETAGKSYQALDVTDGAAVWTEITGGGGSAAWGSITGTLSNQTDLQTALNGKQDSLSFPLSPVLGGTGINNGTNALTIPATGTAALLGTANIFTEKQSITHDAAGNDELIHLWGGTTAPLSGPSIGFYQHYADGAYPNFKVGEIASTWAYPDKADMVFYVNDGADLVNGINMLVGLRLLGVGTGRIDGHFSNGTLYADSSVASQIKIIAKGSSSQSANLQEWQTSEGATRAWVNQRGTLFTTPLDDGVTGTYGVIANFTHTSDNTGGGLLFAVDAENNGLTSGSSLSIGFQGSVFVSALTTNSYNNAIFSGLISWNLKANSSYTAKVNTAVGLVIDAPQLIGAGTFVVTNSAGLRIANQGNSSITTTYGINVLGQSGAGTNYALHTDVGDIRLMASGSDKIGLHGASPVARSSGWSVTGGYTSDKAFDPESTSLTEIARVLGTLIDYLLLRGDLGG